MEKFWSIFVANMPNNLNERFTDYNDAVKEANRRSELFPDNIFLVMELCGYAKGTQSVTTEYIGDINDIIRVSSGDPLNISIAFTDNQGNPLDLSGCNVQFIILPKKDSSDEEAMYNETKINVDPTISPYPENGFSNNVALFYVPNTVTQTKGTYYYQLRIFYPDGIKEIYVDSTFVVE